MWDFLKRQKLQRKGLSCGRKRREQTQSEWIDTLCCSFPIRLLILCLFVGGLAALVRYLPEGATYQFLCGQLGLGFGIVATLSLVAASALHLSLTHEHRIWKCNSRVLLVYLVLLLQLGFVQLADCILRINEQDPATILLYAPCALAPITLTVLLGVEMGFFALLYGSLFGSLLVHRDQAVAFAILSLVLGIVGTLASRRLRKRSQLMRVGLWVGVAGLLLTFLLGGILGPFNLWTGRDWPEISLQALEVLLAGVFTAIIVNGLLPVLESIFKTTTTISWLELADLNHPLLRRMTLEAPGTYHHSLMVASLSEAAAEAVEADSTMARVCAYFHDIGKLERPEYCIENIQGDDNPHDDLSPSMSALIIISHVKDGVDLALKHKLNRQIIDVIQQHHGTSLVWFFYRRALDHQEEMKKLVAEGKANATDIPDVSEAKFRYPGPKARSRESAIISLADAVESASRVLQKPTPQKIEQMVNEIVATRLRDGQLDECD
ncbi:MAG: HDIG domain-containing protein, partial [Verrucomicrobiales bacterium]|nr:HDIG domain-containing protein [Verrucomicrobiales bacterium]